MSVAFIFWYAPSFYARATLTCQSCRLLHSRDGPNAGASTLRAIHRGLSARVRPLQLKWMVGVNPLDDPTAVFTEVCVGAVMGETAHVLITVSPHFWYAPSFYARATLTCQ
jgi:hypothetical protein